MIKIRKANKDYKCESCNKKIKKGIKYLHEYERDRVNIRKHIDCRLYRNAKS